MRAWVRDRYGPPDVMRLVDVPTPLPGPGELLVRVAATGLNLSDWETLVGSPLYARLGGWRRPVESTLGSDIAGWIAAVGPGVAGFAVGDEVYADNLSGKGGLADHAIVPSTAAAIKPPGLDMVTAAALPQSSAIALQGTAALGPGDDVLVNGAGGGTGPFVVQLAKRAGARVTAVDAGHKLELLRALGADDVVDYRTTDFARTGARHDAIIDLVATRSARRCRRALTPDGRYRAVGGGAFTLVRIAAAGLVTRGRVGVLVVREGPEHFAPMADLVVGGEVDVVVDRTFGLDEAPEALRRVGTGRSVGKVVVEVTDVPGPEGSIS